MGLLAYTTLQPELEKQQAEQRGEFREKHTNNDTIISQAIMSDLKEAKQQVEGDSKGFAWGIREKIWGSPEGQQTLPKSSSSDTNTQQANKSSSDDSGT